MNREEQIKTALYDGLNKTPYVESYSFGRGFDKGAKWADSHPAWRMCEDELPEESEWVLVAYNDAYGIGYGVANHFDNHWNTADDNLKIEGIVAWLHLPKFNDKESE